MIIFRNTNPGSLVQLDDKDLVPIYIFMESGLATTEGKIIMILTSYKKEISERFDNNKNIQVGKALFRSQ